MPYRDDLEASKIRIAELEAQLDDARERIRKADSARGLRNRRPWGWLATGGIATLVLVGAGAGQVLYAQEHVADRNVAELKHQLLSAEADAAEAREDRRVALETIAHAYDQRQKDDAQVPELKPDEEVGRALTDPLSDLPPSYLHVESDRPARVAVDGSSLYEWTPTDIRLSPGQHAVSVIAEDGRVRRHTVHIRKGQPSRMAVQFDR